MGRRIGFIGLGLMGRPMALRLLRAGYHVTVWNRTRMKADPLIEEGARVARSLRSLAQQADVVISVVTGPEAVRDIYEGSEGVCAGLRKGTHVVEMSTIGIDTTLQLAQRCHYHGAHLLDAPVTGSVPGAENGTLTVMVGGDMARFNRLRPLLQVFGTPLYVGKQGMGSIVKLAQNLVGAAIVEALAEGMRLAEGYGLDAGRVQEVLTETGVNSGFLRLKGEKMVERDFSVQFSLANMAKDIELALSAAEGVELKLPLAQKLRTVYRSGVKAGFGEADYAILVEMLGEKRRFLRRRLKRA